jgi:post-segregation antitoxin (ccd killing protein)
MKRLRDSLLDKVEDLIEEYVGDTGYSEEESKDRIHEWLIENKATRQDYNAAFEMLGEYLDSLDED